MRKSGKPPTLNQIRLLSKHKLDHMDWHVIKNLPHHMECRNKYTGEYKIIEKRLHTS